MNTRPPAGAPYPSISARTIHKAVILLVLAGLAAYANSFTGAFHADDFLWISRTDHIKDLGEYLSTMRNRPFIALSLYANYHIHELSTFGYHLVNVAIHITGALTLFGIVRRTLLLPDWRGRFTVTSPWLAFFVALFWMVHPLQTQAVTYIIQRCESLMGLCYLLTMYCLLRGTQSSRPWRWYLAGFISCVVGAGSKEVMMTIVPVLLAYDRVFVAPWKELWQRRWLFYLVILAFSLSPLLVHVPLLNQADPDASAGFAIPGLPLGIYWMTQAWVLVYYLSYCFIPYPQHFSYRDWPATTSLADFAPAGMFIGISLGLIGWLLLRRHGLGFLGWWFFGILSITSVMPLLDVAFEHRLYLPLAAVCTLVAVGGYQGLLWFDEQIRISLHASSPKKAKPMAPSTSAWLPAGLGVLLGLAIGTALTVLTVRRNEDYRSAIRIWSSVEKLYPHSWFAINAIAEGYFVKDEIDQAMENYKKSLMITPANFIAGFRYGEILCMQDQAAQGMPIQIGYMDKLLFNPNLSEGIGETHYEMGNAVAIQGQWEKAVHYFRKAAEMAPKKARHHAALALALNERKDAEQAREAYQRALQWDADWPRKAWRRAHHVLHDHPHPSAWTRKEGLLYAKQAAQATEYADAQSLELLAEACAANGMYPQAEEFARTTSQALLPVHQAESAAQLNRMITFYRKQDPSRNGKSVHSQPGK